MSSRSLFPALLQAERQGRVSFLARGPDEARYWSVLALTRGGLRGWVAGSTHYVIEEPLESWSDPAACADGRRAWGDGGGSLPTPSVFVEIGGAEGWLLISATETADILGRRSLHWALALSRPEGQWLAVPPVGYISHDAPPTLDPLFGDAKIITSLREAMNALAALSVRLARKQVRLTHLYDKVDLPVLKTGPVQSIVNEWYSVTRA